MDNPAWISVPISIVALVVSAASWWHNWSTHRDKRYGDIAALRSQLLQRLLNLIEKLRDMEMALDAAQLDLLRLDGKQQEKIDHYSKGIEDFVPSQTETHALWEIIEQFTPETHNTSKHLRYLQSTAHTVALTEVNTDQLDRIAKRRIEMIRAATESAMTVNDWATRIENDPRS